VASPFVPVHLAGDPTTAVLEIEFRDGAQLQIRPGASTELVRATVAALRASC
jgi:hypothetical protein